MVWYGMAWYGMVFAHFYSWCSNKTESAIVKPVDTGNFYCFTVFFLIGDFHAIMTEVGRQIGLQYLVMLKANHLYPPVYDLNQINFTFQINFNLGISEAGSK